jgi:glycolate oxidase iron-sulfur subunit
MQSPTRMGFGHMVSAAAGGAPPSYDQLIHCMRCGLCLSVCPTYSLQGIEKSSPRGRLAIMRAVSEMRLRFSPNYGRAMDSCLACLACQTACPAGVPYGHLIEQAREYAAARSRAWPHALVRRTRAWLLGSLLSSPHGLETMAVLIRAYQRVGLQRLNLARLLPGPLGSWERLLPQLPGRSAYRSLGTTVEATLPLRGRVGLLLGCIENTVLADICVSTARVLAVNGYDVVIPPDQKCCGALPGHVGETELARKVARRNIDVFEAAGVETVISDAAGCSAQLKDYGHLLANDRSYAAKAATFSQRAQDATEFLAHILPLRAGMRALPLRVAYDDPCHLIHAQGISAEPRALLRSIPGLELLDLPESSWCCGSAGTYNLTHSSESMRLLQRKIDHVLSLHPDVLATANTGCYLQLKSGLRKSSPTIEVLHVVQLLARAYGDQRS